MPFGSKALPMSGMIWISLSLVVVSFVISVPLVWALVAAGGRLGHLDRPGAESHKAHGRAVPNIGRWRSAISYQPELTAES